LARVLDVKTTARSGNVVGWGGGTRRPPAMDGVQGEGRILNQPPQSERSMGSLGMAEELMTIETRLGGWVVAIRRRHGVPPYELRVNEPWQPAHPALMPVHPKPRSDTGGHTGFSSKAGPFAQYR